MDETGIPFDRIADGYDETRGYPDVVMNDVLRVMSGELREDALILDAGVGTGRFACPLQARGYHVVGIDIADRMIDKARQKRTEDILKANACFMPFRDKSFDTTVSVHVLHLVAEWRRALREIVRVTNRNLVSVVSNKEKSPAQEVRRAYERSCGDLGHPTCPPGIRERELQRLLKPDRVKNICVYVRSIDVQQMIDGMQNRLLSVQWSVPDEIHLKAIEGLRRQFEGMVQLPEVESISVIVWRIDRLSKFASSPTDQPLRCTSSQK